tara:strand:- start:2794 stop:3558 length:765 start_codon:yes stop_codon:yes gene_type:complete
MLDINKIYNDLEKNGYAIIDKFWDQKISNEIDDYYTNNLLPLIKDTKIDKFGNRNFSLADDELDNSPFEKIKKSSDFINLYENLLKMNHIQIKNKIDVHNVVMLQKNEIDTNFKVSSKFHFDAFYLTAIFPIKIPEDKKKDNFASLIIYPNIRNIAMSSYTNYIFKFLTQNSICRKIANYNFIKKIFNSKVVDLQENKIILFYGYRTYHGNQAMKSNNLKAQAIYHIYNPHKESRIDNYVFNRNKKIRKNKLVN